MVVSRLASGKAVEWNNVKVMRQRPKCKHRRARADATGALPGETLGIAYGIHGGHGDGCHGETVVRQERAVEAKPRALPAFQRALGESPPRRGC